MSRETRAPTRSHGALTAGVLTVLLAFSSIVGIWSGGFFLAPAVLLFAFVTQVLALRSPRPRSTGVKVGSVLGVVGVAAVIAFYLIIPLALLGPWLLMLIALLLVSILLVRETRRRPGPERAAGPSRGES